MGGESDERVVDLTALYRAPVMVCAERGSGRYHATLAIQDRVVLDAADPLGGPGVEVGELVSLGCADLDGWITGQARVVAVRDGGLVTTAPTLSMCQRRSVRRIPIALPVDVGLLDDPDLSATGRTVDLSERGMAAQVAPVAVAGGDGLRVRIRLPQGPDVSAEAEVVQGGATLRTRFTRITERDRDRLVGVLSRTELRRSIRR